MKSNRLGLAMILAGGFAWSQPAGSAAGPFSVRATGESSIYAMPDEAKLDIGVLTEAASARDAGTKNAAQTQAVLARLREALGPKADIRTLGYSLNPNYQAGRGAGKPTINGYRAVNTVEITSTDLGGLGKLIDAATEGGANEIQRLQFVLKKENPAHSQALVQATREAHANAEAMAAAIGLKIGRTLSIEQSSSQPVRPMMASLAQTVNATATPVEVQPIEVRASVILTAELASGPLSPRGGAER